MSWLDRLRGRRRPDPPPAVTETPAAERLVFDEAAARLRAFAASHPGVEGFVEPATSGSGPTMVFVARDGEWTRRRVPNPAAAHHLANSVGVPSYDVKAVGYPQRMRDWTHRQRRGGPAAPAPTRGPDLDDLPPLE